MKYEKPLNSSENFLQGVSTLDARRKFLSLILPLLLMAAFSGAAYASYGHSILDAVDPTFNPQIRTDSFGLKSVVRIVPLPDGKILVSGYFNSYNRQPVGSLIRLNADATLDATFDNNVLAAGTYATSIVLQPDGKIVICGLNLRLNGQTTPTDPVIRLNQDGSVDTAFDFNFGAGYNVSRIALDASGRILVSGNFPEPGVSPARKMIRLTANGTVDSSFTYISAMQVDHFATQGNKVIFSSQGTVRRLNEDGSLDTSFTPKSFVYPLTKIIIQPDNKVVVLETRKLQRLNENGGDDASFTPQSFVDTCRDMHLGTDGRITVADGPGAVVIKRFLPNGAPDTSFSPFSPPSYGTAALLPDNSLIVGDIINGSSGTTIYNEFLRVLPNGIRDSNFNVGGIGFQTINPGSVRAITIQPDGKVLIGGRFDAVNEVARFKFARLNADSTLDTSFQINTNPSGNYFTQIREIYHSVVQSDGKIIVSGGFTYVLNGAAKSNVVRLNADGSIDTTFNLSVVVLDYFAPNRAGTNKLSLFEDGKLLVAASRNSPTEPAVPFKLINGARDTTFNPIVNPAHPTYYIHDAAIQPDGKILIAGRYHEVINTGPIAKSFILRLNANGSLDSSFQSVAEAEKEISALALLSTGKILIVKNNAYTVTAPQSSVLRLNSDGSPDASFSAGTGAAGRINTIAVLPTGRIFVGGKFASFNNQPRQNLALLSADGNLDPTAYNVNEEVLSLVVDGDGRVLVGGNFTTINIGGGQNYTRSYLARLIDSSATNQRTRFDFDGDGKADLGVFTESSGVWAIRRSLTDLTSETQFGQPLDRIAPADYDDDGRADVAVYRPAQGIWYLLRSTAGFTAIRWGAAEDKPVPADYDGDGQADVAVWRPSNGNWYILRSGAGSVSYQFGATGDVPVPSDFDGDGKTDVAVWRPSNGTFYWLASGSNNLFKAMQFGQVGDIPAIADYNGDRRADLVVFRPSNGVWYQYLTVSVTIQSGVYTFKAIQFGQTGDEPVAADYDGDGKTDVAVRRQGMWHILKSGQGYSGVSFGNANAQAVAGFLNQ